MNTSQNPSAIRSREMLTDALLTLMEEKDFQNIHINEIAQRADINRRTFYRNFDSKEEIIQQYGNELIRKMGKSIQEKGDYSFQAVCEAYFTFWSSNLSFLKLLQKNRLLYFLFENFEGYHDKLHEYILPDIHSAAGWSAYENAFATGGFWSILVKWLEMGATHSPADMSAVICGILQDPFELHKTVNSTAQTNHKNSNIIS